MNVIKLIVVSPAGWTNRQEHVPDYLREEKGEVRVAGRLVDCLATTTGMLPKSHFVREFLPYATSQAENEPLKEPRIREVAHNPPEL
jgi:hypothetical protein